MNPETKLAMMLSSDETKQKLASEMSDLCIDDLEGILKESKGNAQQSVFRQAWDGAKKGWREGNEAHDKAAVRASKAAEKYRKKHGDDNPDEEDKIWHAAYDKKASAEELIDFAESLGRGLAQKNKEAGLFNRSNLRSIGRKAKQVAGTVGEKARGAVGETAKRLSDIKDPIARGAAIGGITGGVSGGLQGFLDPKEDHSTGKKMRLRTAFRKGLAGAAAGAPTGALFGAMQKSSSIQSLKNALEKNALGMSGIGSMARNFVSQAKPMAQRAMSAAAPAIQRGMGALGSSSMGRAAGMGAAAGGAMGAAKGLIAPGKDAQGNTRSRIGGALKGGVVGAGAGAALGAGAKSALPHAQKMQRLLGA